MKQYLFAGVGALVALIAGLFAYGSYLNYSGEKQILSRIADERIPVKGMKAERRNLYPAIVLPTISFSSNNLTDVVTLADGRIVNFLVQKNDVVNEGQIICTLVDEEMPMKLRQADSGILEAEANAVAARNNLDRYQRLYGERVVSKAKLEEMELSYRVSLSKWEDAKAKKDLLLVRQSHLQVASPVRGTVLLFYREKGAEVKAGTAVALVGDFQEMRCEMTLDDALVQRLAENSRAYVFLNAWGTSSVFRPEEQRVGSHTDAIRLEAEVEEMDPPLGTPAPSRRVVWRIDNSSGLLEPKTYHGTKWQSTVAHNCLAVPLHALTDDNRDNLFVLLPDGTLEERTVATGVQDGEYIEIVSGLEEGEIVVTSFPAGLTDGMKAVLESSEGSPEATGGN